MLDVAPPVLASGARRSPDGCSLPFLLLVSPEEEPAHLFQLHIHGGGGRQHKLPSSGDGQGGCGAPMPSAEEEAYMVSELLGCQPLVGGVATKRVIGALTQAESSTSPPTSLETVGLGPHAQCGRAPLRGRQELLRPPYTIPESCGWDDIAMASISDCPPLQELLLTAADILDLRLPVKLVVLGSSQESSSRITADGVVADWRGPS